MRMKQDDAEWDEKCARRKFVEASIEYAKVIKKDKFVDEEFKRIMKTEVEYVWNTGKFKNRNKIPHLVEKYHPKYVLNVEELRNVK